MHNNMRSREDARRKKVLITSCLLASENYLLVYELLDLLKKTYSKKYKTINTRVKQ